MATKFSFLNISIYINIEYKTVFFLNSLKCCYSLFYFLFYSNIVINLVIKRIFKLYSFLTIY